MRSFRRIAAALVVAAVGTAGTMAQADEAFPNKPIRMVVPFAAGGPTDVIARVIATRMKDLLGQPVVVENRVGAGGNIAINSVARSTPDGYTLLFASSNIVSNPSLYEKPPFDPIKDFAPVTYAAVSPNIIYVHPSVKANNVAELVALLKEPGSKLSFGTPGLGTTPHLACEGLRLTLNAEAVHVPFQGAAPVVAAVLGNQVPIGCSATPPVVPHIKSGALLPIAVTSARRSGALPDVPTLAESGFPGVVTDNMQGVLAPAGTPRPVIDKLNKAIVTILKEPATAEKLSSTGLELYGTSPEEFASIIRKEVEQYANVIRRAKIQVQ